MENCLVTKLKSAVNNSNLEKLGIIALKGFVNSTSNRLCRYNVADGTEATLKILTPGVTIASAAGNCVKVNDTTLVIKPKGSQTYNGMIIAGSTAPLTFDVEISNKYNLTEIYDSVSVNLEGFKFIDILTINSCGLVKGDLSILAVNNPTITNLIVHNEAGVNTITGKFSDLGVLVNLSHIHLWQCPSLTQSTVEEFVAKQRGAGRTDTSSSPLKVACVSSPITFNGTILSSTSDVDLSWTASTITYGSTTIDNSDIDTSD